MTKHKDFSLDMERMWSYTAEVGGISDEREI